MAGNKKKYDHIVSLGYNCEFSFQFIRYFDFLDSNLFSWAYIRNHECLINCIKNIDNIMTGEIYGPNPVLYECANSKARFHGRSSNLFDENGKIIEEALKNDTEELKSRINYLKSKFKNLLNSDSKILYALKLKSPIDDEENWEEKNINSVKEIYELLSQKRNGKHFELLVILEEKYYSEQWKKLNINCIYIRTVGKYAPENQTNIESLSDISAWNSIFKEFTPSRKPKRAVLKSFFDFKTAKRSMSLYLLKLFLPNFIRARIRIIGYRFDFCIGQVKE